MMQFFQHFLNHRTLYVIKQFYARAHRLRTTEIRAWTHYLLKVKNQAFVPNKYKEIMVSFYWRPHFLMHTQYQSLVLSHKTWCRVTDWILIERIWLYLINCICASNASSFCILCPWICRELNCKYFWNKKMIHFFSSSQN